MKSEKKWWYKKIGFAEYLSFGDKLNGILEYVVKSNELGFSVLDATQYCFH